MDADADADAGIGAASWVPLGAQKICSIAPGFILVVLPASAFLLSLSLNLMETRMHVHLLALSGFLRLHAGYLHRRSTED